MNLEPKSLVLLPLLLFSCGLNTDASRNSVNNDVTTSVRQVKKSQIGQIKDLSTPEGYTRTQNSKGSFGHWLRHTKLSNNDTVYLYNGAVKGDQESHIAVLDYDIGRRDLQQCADAVIRLRAEYLWSIGAKDKIAFHFTSGHLVKWTDYAAGFRPKISGSKVSFHKTKPADSSYSNFRRYLNLIFTYCGTYSLHKELISVGKESDIKAGDVFIQTGQPYGHAVIVVDCAENEKGEKAYMLAQSYMPAQSIHILLDPSQNYKTAWYRVDKKSIRETPHWSFKKSDLKRFPKN